MAAINLLFVMMNQAALKQGIFAFDHPDFLGMPAYEFLTWGFYTLHTMRFLNGAPPKGSWITVVIATGAYAVPFGTIADSNALFIASSSMLIVFFAMYHEPMDLAYAGCLAVVGELVEHVGEATGQWHYPVQPWGGVPLRLLTLWAGIGLFTRRLVLPLLPNRTRRTVIIIHITRSVFIHSRSFDQRRRARAPLTAIASAFRCPTSTTSLFPRVTPVYTRFRCSIG